MSRVSARPFEARDIAPAAALLAARHQRDRKRLPMLAAALESPAAWTPGLEAMTVNRRADGAVADQDREVVGFLVGERMLLPPDAFASKFVPPHSINLPVDGHAAAHGRDLTTIYRVMYGLLATRWVAEGFFVHTSAIVPGDADMQEAWVAIGFGRELTAATRGTGPVAGATGAEIHQAATEDIEVIAGLSRTLYLHHASSPMFWPLLPETEPAAREFLLAQLGEAAHAHFVAYERGRPIGMNTFLRPGFTPPIVEPEKNVYLFEGVVQPDVQSGGVGKALLEHSMAWCRQQGYELCTLHFAAGNPSGAPFWLGQGFVPVEHTMRRRIDERIAWARG